MKSAEYWIETLNLNQHPEGGYYRETYRSSESIGRAALPGRFSGSRSFSTAIYFLIPGSTFSALHRINSDELWHFYEGSSLTIHVLQPPGIYRQLHLGSGSFQALVPAEAWFGATVDDPQSFTLAGCTVAPGFDFTDFTMGSRSELMHLFPEHSEIISRLTRK